MGRLLQMMAKPAPTSGALLAWRRAAFLARWGVVSPIRTVGDFYRILFLDEAAFAEFGVEAAAGEEFFVAAALDDAAALEDEDFVGVADGGDPVGDDETGAVFHEAVEGFPGINPPPL
jgi:hypothetical protein